MLQISDAHALALGRMIVQSPLGEPLRAEVEVLEITSEEADNLKVGLGPLAAFKAAGMEFNAALVDLRVSLERRANGGAFLRLTGNRPVNEPFMDMVLEASWKSGRVARDYTLLFDPPKLRQPSPAPLAAAVEAQPASAPAPGASAEKSPAPATVVPAAPATVQAPVAKPPAAPASKPAPAAVPTAARNDRLRVQRGDTAGGIALENLPANVSLDQMLVAMLRTNPRAFIKGNVNRVKAGAVLTLPDENTASSVSAGEARQIISAQSRDFNEFRRRLANQVPQAPAATAEREATGQIQAEVKEQKPAVEAQDKLTISKGAAAAGQSAAEDKIAKERAAKEAADRTAELTRNIEELSKVGKETVAAGSVAPTATATVPTEEPQATVASVTADTTAVPAEQKPDETTAVEAPVVQPAPAAEVAPVPPPAPVVAAPQEEASFLNRLLENPMVMPVAGGLLALLAGLGIYGLSRRKKAAGVDSSFLESRLQPDSFFGSSGGQRIDTSEAAASGSSMVYSPSQLDAAGDVDPVAEADVYLAYGRDLQAEEILKEAMRSTPTRVAIHNKLLEIYAKRRDAKAFEVVATEAFGLTQGEGSEWEHACELGKELDPTNPLYQPGGRPPEKPGVPAGSAGAAAFGVSTLTQNTKPGYNPSVPADLDFDLDLDLDQPSQPADISIGGSPLSGLDDLDQTDALTSTPAPEVLGATAANSEPMAFDLDFPSEPMPLSSPASDQASLDADEAGSTPSTFDEAEVIPDFDLISKADAPPSVAAELSGKADSEDLMSFDLNDIKLDLNAEETSTTEAGALSDENPLETKLSLAEEFRAIGDLEGARSLAEEVMVEAKGALKSKVSAFLADLA
ncbi:FimV/HubP family polar landmark protein [Hydrogenophaga crassostreae]|nr:FimV/HubP family polar landmark protein [Hydrogenophaga crassostreae]